jgi:L-threonylcarbamoyladenylate synthase
MPCPDRLRLDLLCEEDVVELAERIRAARMVCFPTETVYGVGGALTPRVSEALIAAKGRDPAKPLQVIFPSLDVLERTVGLSPRLLRASRALLPGPLTLVVRYPAGWTYPPPAPAGTLGVRVPVWPHKARHMGELPFPMIASSANPSGKPAPASLDEVDATLLAACDLVLDGGRVSGVSSSVIDLSRYEDTGVWTVLRPGAMDEAEIAARLQAAAEGRS